MAFAPTIEAKKRELRSKGYLREMRRMKWIPGVVYGKGSEPLPIFLPEHKLSRLFITHGSRGLFSIELEGEQTPLVALVREVQKNALSGNVLHVDFLTVRMDEKVTAMVGIHIIGEEEATKDGGILQMGAKEVEVSCLPQDLPEQFTCDVSSLQVGDKITVADLHLQLPAGVEILGDGESVVVSILAPGRGTDIEEEAQEEQSEEEPEAPEE